MIKEDVRKGFTSGIYNYLGLFFEKLVTVFVTVYVIRQLPVADFGLFNLFQDTIFLVATVFSLGIPSLIERFLPELYERGMFAELHRWVYRALAARFSLGFLGALICLVGRNYLGAFLNSADFAALFPIFALGLVFTILNQTAQTVLDTFLMQRRRNVIRMIVSTLRAGLYLAAITLGLGLLGILWAFSLAALIGSSLFVLTIIHLRYPENIPVNDRDLKGLTDRFKRYGFYSYLNEMGGLVLSRRVDNYLISSFLNPAAVGIYSFAARIVDMILSLSPLRVGNLIISTILFRQYTDNPTQEFLQRRFHLLLKLAYFLTLPILMILIGLRAQITEVIDPRYREACNIIAVIAGWQVLNTVSMPIAWMAKSTERVEVQLYSKIGAVYNIISALLLIPRFGPIGAAWATGSSTLMKNALMFFFLRRHLPLQFPLVALGKLGLAGLLALATLSLLANYATGAFSLLMVALCGILLFIGLVKMLQPFDSQERSALKKVFGRIWWII